ncbi:hypothetical protein GCM10011571_06310 [Marinithermofilum abyssi]|uniref:Uncharacterized protein n=1 Tax=Marinithermofilum abyssi TaxID=1571185 RepID=A0A8J2YCG7_9BACL|nr:hypothetical protein GCM10011571_06310 [Marinithermofilum abyssi]
MGSRNLPLFVSIVLVIGMDDGFAGRALEKAMKIFFFVDLKYITTLTGYGYNFIETLIQSFSHLVL